MNSRTIKDSYPLPRTDETVDYLQGAKWFAKLDLRAVYWQVDLEEEDKPLMAFTEVHLIGLTSASATFQRLMSLV